MSDHDDNETEIETPLPITYDLPEFEGIIPIGVVTTLNGSGQRITRPMHYGERGVLVVEYEVEGVGHNKTNDGMKRHHKLKVLDLYELPGKPGSTLLRSLRQAHRTADDLNRGTVAIAGFDVTPEGNAAGIEVTVDEKGRVHTAVGAGLAHIDVAVLVFEDEVRALWPDDFDDATGPHPEAGERIRKPGAKVKDDPALIRRVLDADTGETLEEWTDEQENERLLELEHELAVEEARQDREAVEELEAARAKAQAATDAGPALDASLPPLPGEPIIVEDPDGFADIADQSHPKFRAVVLMQDPVSGTARAIGSVKGDLAAVDDVAVIEAAIDYERAGKNRAGMLEILEARAGEIRS